MYCVHCGKQLIPNTKFCGGCGRGIDESHCPELTAQTAHRQGNSTTVSVAEQLFASTSFTSLFTMILLVSTHYSRYAEIFVLGEIIGQSVVFDEMLLISRTFEMLIPSLVASLIIVWSFMPRVISDYKDGASLKALIGRLFTLTACIISVSILLRLPQARVGDTSILDMLTPIYFVKVGILCVPIAPFVYKIVKLSTSGKSARALTTLVFLATILIDLIASVLLSAFPAGAAISSFTKIATHIAAGGLTVLLFIIGVAIIRGFKKVS